MRHEAPNALLQSDLGETPVKVIVFGASGMVGQGVLRECLLDPIVGSVLAVGRSGSGKQHEKLRDRVLADFAELPAFEADLAGLDACFFCLGVSSAGMTEADYRRVTYDLTTSIARVLVGRAMIEVAKHGAPTSIVENRDINALAASSPSRSQPS
jgi:nucleoside-diphosphate-sugar epimerase